jgi:hypothetical protein
MAINFLDMVEKPTGLPYFSPPSSQSQILSEWPTIYSHRRKKLE